MIRNGAWRWLREEVVSAVGNLVHTEPEEISKYIEDSRSQFFTDREKSYICEKEKDRRNPVALDYNWRYW